MLYTFGFDIQNILLIITMLMNLVLGILIFTRQRTEYESRVYTINILFILWWIASMLMYRTGTDPLLWSTISLYLAPTFIASSFLYFTLLFPNSPVKNYENYLPWIALTNVCMAYLTATPGYVIKSVTYVANSENIINFGFLYPLYAIYISGFFGAGLIILAFKHAHFKKNVLKRRQILYLLFGYSVASTTAMITNLILPYAGNFAFNWLGQVLTLFMVVPVTYAIFKHRLFDVKIIATEILIVALWVLIFIRTLLSGTIEEMGVNAILLISTFIIGLLLIRSVSKEVEQREHIEALANNLEHANTRLKALDRQKTEFLGIAAHQLRTPIAAIKGYASLVLEGSFGKLTKKIQEPIQTIFDSSNRMAGTIDDFLNISRIEQGRMEYVKKQIDLEDITKKSIEAAQIQATAKNIGLSFSTDGCAEKQHLVYADPNKIQHVINNLLDNAIKYTKSGTAKVSLTCDRKNHLIRFAITDTGAGIPKEAIRELFDKFVRARNARQINVTGSGLGLYVAKQMIEAHDGKIWAESGGEGKGSTFIFEIPLLDNDKS